MASTLPTGDSEIRNEMLDRYLCRGEKILAKQNPLLIVLGQRTLGNLGFEDVHRCELSPEHRAILRLKGALNEYGRRIAILERGGLAPVW
jgi:hypothetical protein